MAAIEPAIFTNMCMVSSGSRVLVQDRTDPSWPGVCFPGGHVEPGESFTESVKREVFEETGIRIEQPRLCAVKQFRSRGARYVVLMYKATRFSGEPRGSEEGNAFWVERDQLTGLRRVEGFSYLLQAFDDEACSEIYYAEGVNGPQLK
ncbi:MAG: 8-oxo-dGTP diphosphatase [Provencibacterium sp.]|jgi:8-oxo-dGTP diphosphatase|nr:8-oxo-dGTP diphosphatase [Provencibacterium sp.]